MATRLALFLEQKKEQMTSFTTQDSANSTDSIAFHTLCLPSAGTAAVGLKSIEENFRYTTQDFDSKKWKVVSGMLLTTDDFTTTFQEKDWIVITGAEPDFIEKNLREISRRSSVNIDASSIINQNTSRLDVFSDGIAPAILYVLWKFGPLNLEQIVECGGMDRHIITSRLQTLFNTGLVEHERNQYNLSKEGLKFLEQLPLPEISSG